MSKIEIMSAGYKAVVDSKDSQLCSLVKNDTQYLWQGDPAFWSSRAPVCFPIVGVLKDGTASAFGKECKMKRHGVARIFPFSVAAQCNNSVTLLQKSDEQTKELFPFDYELKIKYTVNGDTLTNEYIVANTGASPLPFQIGGHPAFNCPLDSDEDFEDYKVIFSNPITSPCLRPDHITGLVDCSKEYDVMHGSDTLCLEHNLFEENDALIFKNCAADSAVLIGKNGKGVKIDFPDMDNLLVWSAVGNAPFVALEPWTGISDYADSDGIFEHKAGVKILNAGEEISLRFKITLI